MQQGWNRGSDGGSFDIWGQPYATPVFTLYRGPDASQAACQATLGSQLLQLSMDSHKPNGETKVREAQVLLRHSGREQQSWTQQVGDR